MHKKYFERVIPEDVGISSLNIADFLRGVQDMQYQMHSFLLMRHGKVAAEVCEYPYHREDKRLIYSSSKTFTSTAVGIAVKEGLLNVEDRVLDYFKEYDTPELDPRVGRMKVENLLMMATGHGTDSIGDVCNGDDNWVRTFFTREMTYEPGEKFVYDSGGTYMLSEIVTKVTGKKMADYLREKLLDPLEIKDFLWEIHGQVNTGAWGVLIAPEDLAKLGMLYLQKGKWKEEQILTQEWVERASSELIRTGACQHGWSQGYGYQIWRNNEKGYRADGAFGQLCMVFPEENMVIAVTAEEADPSRVFPLIEKYLLAGLSDKPEMRNAKAVEILMQELKKWELPVVTDPTSSYLEFALPEWEYSLTDEEEKEEHHIRFSFSNSVMEFEIDGIQRIESSNVTYKDGETEYVIMPPSCSPIIGEEQRKRKWKYSAHHEWVNDGTVMVSVVYRETGHVQKWLFTFTDKKVNLVISNSCKKLFGLFFDMVSDKNVDFADIRFTGSR